MATFVLEDLVSGLDVMVFPEMRDHMGMDAGDR